MKVGWWRKGKREIEGEERKRNRRVTRPILCWDPVGFGLTPHLFVKQHVLFQEAAAFVVRQFACANDRGPPKTPRVNKLSALVGRGARVAGKGGLNGSGRRL